MVSIPTDNNIPMDFFDGSFDNQGGFGWDESEDDTVITITNGNGQDSTFFEDFFSFNFEIDSIGWINCDYFYNSADPLTQVEVVYLILLTETIQLFSFIIAILIQ